MKPPAQQSTEPVALHREMRGIHAGAIVFAGVVVTNVGNYAFHLFAAQRLGPADYGGVVSLLALASLIGLPLAGVQLAVARYVSSYSAQGADEAIRGVFVRGLAIATAAGATITIAFLALVPVLERLLGIDDTLGIVLTAVLTLTAVWTPVVWGVTQGLQRFGLLAFSMSAGTAMRFVLLVVLLVQGGRLAGAMLATVLGAIVSLAICAFPLRHYLRLDARAPIGLRLVGRQVLPVVGGLLAIASLTSLDVIIAKISLDEHDAGLYSGASVIGRVILYAPAAIATVLLPKVSSRVESERETTDIVGASLAVTLVLCGVAAAVYAAFPTFIVTTALGEGFADAGPLLWKFGIAMTGYALLNLLLVYHVGHGTTRMTWLLLAGALAQLVGYALFHDSPNEIVTVSIAAALLLVTAHELLITSGGRMTYAWLIEVRRVLRARRRGA